MNDNTSSLQVSRLKFGCKKEKAIIFSLLCGFVFGILLFGFSEVDVAEAVAVGEGTDMGWSFGWSSGIFNNVGFGNFASGGVEGGAGVLTEAEVMAVIEAIIDSYFQDGDNIDFVAALIGNSVGKGAYEKMIAYDQKIAKSGKDPYYKNFIEYVNTPEGALKALQAAKETSMIYDVTLPTSKISLPASGTPASQTPETQAEGNAEDDFVDVVTGGCLSGMWTGGLFGVSLEEDSSPSSPNYNKIMENYWLKDAKGNIIRDSKGNPIVDVGKYSKDVSLTADEIREKYSSQGTTGGSKTTSGGSGSGSSGTGGGNEPATNTNTTCTSYTYGEWSACAGGVQSRSILHQYPSGCTDTATAVLTQNCTMPAVACTSYTYSDWSACVGGNQTRAIASKLPSGCTDTATAVFTQACTAECTASQIPLVTNTTAATQSVNSATLSLITDRSAKCEYRENGGFTFGTGAGTDFKVTGNYNHNSGLTGVTAGAKTYYAVCKDATANCFSAPLKIEFTAESASSTEEACIGLTSNDRKNNANRSYFGTAGADSTYLWQAVETGTRDKFEKVDWYAGYQLTPEKDGKVNQLCGNFPAGAVNRVSLYDGSYEELAGAEITGDNFWRCVDIAPVQVKTDRRYYVIARIEDDPVYFEFKSGMLPKAAGNAVIEVGVRQSASSGDFGEDERKTYDHMIFGLVDVRISWAPQTLSGPAIASFEPRGNVDDDHAVLSVQASDAAECRFGREDVSYDQMDYPMNKTTTGKFTGKVCNLEKGAYTFYARCKDGGGAKNNVSAATTFTITQ